jgi:adenylate cyclase
MPTEIERKYLINLEEIDLPKKGVLIKQGFIPVSSETKTVVRVRIKGSEAFLTIKGGNIGATRLEFEYQIPFDDAEEMLANLCLKPLIEKTRFELNIERHCWEVDVFHGENNGLVIAEIELSEEGEEFALPTWIAKEVTDDPKYYNSNLLEHPYNLWGTT